MKTVVVDILGSAGSLSFETDILEESSVEIEVLEKLSDVSCPDDGSGSSTDLFEQATKSNVVTQSSTIVVLGFVRIFTVPIVMPFRLGLPLSQERIRFPDRL